MPNSQKGIRQHEQSVMQRHCPLPVQAAQERGAVIFLIGRKGGKVQHQEIRQRQQSQWRDDESQQPVTLLGAQQESNRRDDISNVDRQRKFTKAVIQQPQRRDRVRQDDEKRDQQKVK